MSRKKKPEPWPREYNPNAAKERAAREAAASCLPFEAIGTLSVGENGAGHGVERSRVQTSVAFPKEVDVPIGQLAQAAQQVVEAAKLLRCGKLQRNLDATLHRLLSLQCLDCSLGFLASAPLAIQPSWILSSFAVEL